MYSIIVSPSQNKRRMQFTASREGKTDVTVLLPLPVAYTDVHRDVLSSIKLKHQVLTVF